MQLNWPKINRKISIILLGVMQVAFLFMIVRENAHVGLVSLIIIGLLLSLLVAHRKLDLHHQDHLYENMLVAIWIPVGAVISYYLNNGLHLGPIMAAGLVGTIASVIPEFNKRSAYLKHVPPAIYCGAFIGMSSLKVANGAWFVIAASLFATIGMILSKSLFSGIGGKLGLIAFAGVVLTSLILFVFSNYVQ